MLGYCHLNVQMLSSDVLVRGDRRPWRFYPILPDLLPLRSFTDHLCPPSSPPGRSTTLHLKFGTVSGHPQDRRTLSVVLGVA